MRLRKWVWIALAIMWSSCLIICLLIDINEKATINNIRSQKEDITEVLTTNESKYINQEQMFVYEVKNEVRTDVRAISEDVGIEYELFESIVRHETGNRTSRAYKELNNPCGNMSQSTGKLIHYETKEQGYKSCASNLKRNYIDKGLTTIELIQPKYAPEGAKNDPNNLNSHWLKGVTSIYNELKRGE